MVKSQRQIIILKTNRKVILNPIKKAAEKVIHNPKHFLHLNLIKTETIIQSKQSLTLQTYEKPLKKNLTRHQLLDGNRQK